MIAKAVGRYIRVSPRKARAVIALIKGKDVNGALAILKNTDKKVSSFLIKLLNSAIANARRLPNMRQEDLYIANIFADGGPMLKRYKAQALGRATTIRRRTSHITVELEVREAPPLKVVKKGKRPKQEKATGRNQTASKLKEKKATRAKAVNSS